MYQPRYLDPATADTLKLIGRSIAVARGVHGLSQTGLERITGIDQTTISRLEHGLAPGMRVERLARIAMALPRARLFGLVPEDYRYGLVREDYR